MASPCIFGQVIVADFDASLDSVDVVAKLLTRLRARVVGAMSSLATDAESYKSLGA